MRRYALLRAALPAALAIAMLSIFLVLLASAGRTLPAQAALPDHQAGSSASAPSVVMDEPDGNPPEPDPRWLELVQAQEATVGNIPLANGLSIDLNPKGNFVAGRAPGPLPVTVRVMREEVQVNLSTIAPVPDENGYFYLIYLDCNYSFESCPTQANDVVWVEQAGSAISMTVPLIEALAGAQDDRLYGQAPAGVPLTAYLFPFDQPSASYTQLTSADGEGRFAIDWTGVDLRPRDRGYVLYTQDANRRSYCPFAVPFLRTQVDALDITGYAAPRSSVAITVTKPDGLLIGQFVGSTDANGYFRAAIGVPLPGGRSQLLHAGDRLEASAAGQVFTSTVLEVSAQVDRSTGQVTGTAPAGLAVQVLSFPGPLNSSYYDYNLWSMEPAGQASVTANAQNQYSAALAIPPAGYGVVSVTSPQGHQTYARYAVPYLTIHMGEPVNTQYIMPVAGQINPSTTFVTVTVQGPSGYTKDIFNLYTDTRGNLNPYPSLDYLPLGLTIDSGDVLTLTTRLGVQASLVLPVLTAQANLTTSVVSGLAPPGTRLTVTLQDWYKSWQPYAEGEPQVQDSLALDVHTLVVTATANGIYQADFSSLGGFSRYATGDIQLATDAGHLVWRTFRARPTCPPPPNEITVGGNQVVLQNYETCWGSVLRLLDSYGQVKVEHPLDSIVIKLYETLFDEQNHPVHIQPGDMIETETGEQKLSLPVPQLSLAIDQLDGRVNGTAPPGATVSLLVRHKLDEYDETITATASQQGEFSANLPGGSALKAGDQVRALLHQPQFDTFTWAGLPFLYAHLYSYLVSGLAAPLAPYTLTLQSAGASPLTRSGYADSSGNLSEYLPRNILPGDRLALTTSGITRVMTLPALSASIDSASQTISGHAPPNSQLRVNLKMPGFTPTRVVTATASGQFSLSFADPSLLYATGGTLTHVDETGNWTDLEFSLPRWRVTLDSSCLSGYAQVNGAPVQVSMQAYDGSFSQVVTSTAFSSNAWFAACFERAIQPGDQLEMVAGAETYPFSVPELTALHDYARQVLEGIAPPNSMVEAIFFLYGRPQNYQRRAWADAQGRYGIDTSDLTLGLKDSVNVSITDSRGNVVQRSASITGIRTFMPLVYRTP